MVGLGRRPGAAGGGVVLLYYTVAAKPLIEKHGGVVVMTYAVLLGSAPVVLISLPAGLQVHWSQLGAAVWAGMFYAVLISAFLGWLVWGWVNAVRGVARSAPLMYLMPPVAGLVAWAVTGESYTGIKLAARPWRWPGWRWHSLRAHAATRCATGWRRWTEATQGRQGSRWPVRRSARAVALLTGTPACTRPCCYKYAQHLSTRMGGGIDSGMPCR